MAAITMLLFHGGRLLIFAQPGSVDLSFNADPGPSSNVLAVAFQGTNRILVGGGFQTLNGVSRPLLGRLNMDGSLDTNFAFSTNFIPFGPPAVYTVSVLPQGSLLVGGRFINRNNTGQIGLTRLNPDGTEDATFHGSANGFATAAGLDGFSRIFVAGSFSQVNYTDRPPNCARLLQDGSLDATFNPPANLGIIAAAAADALNRVVIGGTLSSPGNLLIRLRADGIRDTNFAPILAGLTAGALIIQPDGRMLVGGDFTSVNGVSANRLARLQSDGSLDTNFNLGTGFNNSVFALALQWDGKILVGGSFTNFNGALRRGLARLNSNGTLDQTFATGAGARGSDRDFITNLLADGFVYDVAVGNDGRILAGGHFLSFDGQPRRHVVVLGGDPLAPPARIGPFTNQAALAGQPTTLSVAASGVPRPSFQWMFNGAIVPGATGQALNFRSARVGNAGTYSIILSNELGVVTNEVVSLAVTPQPVKAGLLDASFRFVETIDGTVNALAVQEDGGIVIGGTFTQIGAIPRGGVARLTRDGRLDASFDPGAGMGSPNTNSPPHVDGVALQRDGKVLVAGYFSMFNGVPRGNLVRLHPDGAVDTNFSSGSSSLCTYVLRTVFQQVDGKVVIGGWGCGDGGSGFARLGTDGNVDPTFHISGVGSDAWAVALAGDGKYIIGGRFSLPYHGLVRVRSDGFFDFAFNSGTGPDSMSADPCIPNPGGSQGIGPTVMGVAVQQDGKVIVGGLFTSFAGVSRSGVVRLNANGTVDTTFITGTGTDHSVWTVALQPDGKVLIGGCFTSFNGVPCNRLARLNSNGSFDTTFYLGA